MIVHGWKNLGERTMGTSATSISLFANELEAEYFIPTDGFSYCLLASASVNGKADLDIYGTWFDTESTQDYKHVINSSIGTLDSGGTNGYSLAVGDLGVETAMGVYRIANWVDDTNSGHTKGQMMGLMSRVAGFAGPESAETSGAAVTSYGSFDGDEYITSKGHTNSAPFVIIPCGLFSGLQITQYDQNDPLAAQVGTVLYCLIQ